MDAKKQKIEKVSKPYIKGDMIDKTTMPGALKFFGGTVTMAVIFLIMGVMMNMETPPEKGTEAGLPQLVSGAGQGAGL